MKHSALTVTDLADVCPGTGGNISYLSAVLVEDLAACPQVGNSEQLKQTRNKTGNNIILGLGDLLSSYDGHTHPRTHTPARPQSSPQ